MQDIIKMIIFILTSLVFSSIAISLAAKESKEYVLNTKETLIVFFIAIMFGVWLILGNWNVSNWTAIMILNACFAVLSVSFYIDAKLQELPDRITILVLVAAGLLLLQPEVLKEGIGAFSSRFVLASVVTAAAFVFSIKTENLGMGDVKLLFPILLLVGTNKIIFYTYNVLIPAFIVSLIYLAIKRGKDLKIAFGPFLIVGFVLTFSVFPESIFIW